MRPFGTVFLRVCQFRHSHKGGRDSNSDTNCVTSRFSRYIIDYCPYHVIVNSCFFIHLYIRQIAILFKAEFAYFLVVCGSLEQFALLVSYCLPKWVLRVCLRAFSTPPVGNDTVGYEYPLWNSMVVIDLHYLRIRFSSVSITVDLNSYGPSLQLPLQ